MPNVVVGLRVARSESFAPVHIIRGVHIAVVVARDCKTGNVDSPFTVGQYGVEDYVAAVIVELKRVSRR